LQYTVWKSASATAEGAVVNENVITIAGSSAQSPTVMDPNAGGARAKRRVRVSTDAACWVTWGSDPTALDDGTAGRMMHADSWEYFDIEAGERIAVIEKV
jgi:hypothetical protein